MNPGTPHSYLLVRCRAWLCALPLAEVIETLRPLPLQPVAGAPAFVRGLSLVRGELVPVVELALLLGAEGGAPGRLVVVRAATRRLALAVDAVLRIVPHEQLPSRSVAPLLSKALPAQVTALAVLDGAALAVLESTSVLPEEAWATLAPLIAS